MLQLLTSFGDSHAVFSNVVATSSMAVIPVSRQFFWKKCNAIKKKAATRIAWCWPSRDTGRGTKKRSP